MEIPSKQQRTRHTKRDISDGSEADQADSPGGEENQSNEESSSYFGTIAGIQLVRHQLNSRITLFAPDEETCPT
eukprot:5233344-Karenia_brevis.AAC.1